MPQAVVAMTSSAVGFYGKLPVAGDFISRRLPRHFIQPLDLWIQNIISISRKKLNADWLDLYLTSPIWRFALSPGICGETGWIGLIMPSVDKVGRYFPFILAGEVANINRLSVLLVSHNDWFVQLEDVALAALEEQLTIDNLNDALQNLPIPDIADNSAGLHRGVGSHSDSHLLAEHALSAHLSASNSLTLTALAALNHFETYSIWLNPGQIGMVKIFSRLPSGEDYVQMLN